MLIHSPKQLGLIAMDHRKKLKLSQAEVGNLVGLGQKTISAFENKPESMQLNTVFRILSALNLDILISDKDTVGTTNEQWDDEW